MLLHNTTIRHVLHHFGHAEGQDGGDFANALLDAMTKADRSNLGILVRAFPAIGNVFEVVKDHPRGVEVLERVLALNAAGFEVRLRDIMPPITFGGRAGWVREDVLTGVTLEDAIARELSVEGRLI